MDKRTLRVEWTIAESDAEWERLQEPPLPEGDRRRHLKRYVWPMAALLLLLAGVGGWEWHTTQAAAKPGVTAQPALAAIASGHALWLASVIGDQKAIDGGRQLVPAINSLPTSRETYESAAHGDGLQKHFYCRTTTEWLRTEPNAALRSPERSLATPYFVYHFCQNDAEAVIAVAPQVDALYRIMRRNFGLPLTLDAEKLVIDVSVTQSPETALFQPHDYEHFVMADRLVVASPALYLAPVELSDADLLAQSIALPLLEDMVTQAREQYQIGAAWQPMMAGLQLWQLWELDLPLSAWREEVVKWLYGDLPATKLGEAIPLPQHYTALCAAHKLWLPSPMQIHIPLMCAGQDWGEINLARWDPHDPLTRLDQLSVPARPDEYATHTRYWQQVHSPDYVVAQATLIEYAVATYGRERLPVLLASLGQYDSWNTLLPAVYGVSPAEFEAGWQAYLAMHYGVVPDARQ